MPNFNFKSQFPIAEVIAAAQRKPQMEAEMEAQKEQIRQARFKTLLDALSTGGQMARLMSQNKTDALAREQTKNQMAGQKDLQSILAEPQPNAPVAPPIQQFSAPKQPLGPATAGGEMPPIMPPQAMGTVQPTFGGTQQGANQEGRIKSATIKAFPEAAGKEVAAQQFGDPLEKGLKMAQIHKLMQETKTGNVDAKSKLESTLRDDFSKASGQFADVAQSYQRIEDSLTDPSAAGDLALIFNFMKMLDPGSTVREGEFANAQNAGGIDSRMRAMYNKIISGERLDPKMRGDFSRRSSLLYKGQEKLHSQRENEYRRIATNSGIDAENVITNMRAIMGLDSNSPTAQASAAPAPVAKPKPSVAPNARYDQLKKEGLSDEDIYKTMAEEGF